ncbi:ATP-binding protein [Nonomuraea sp. NPDC046802]
MIRRLGRSPRVRPALPIAREIARSHGGTLTFEDSGARFVVRLPIRAG